MRTFALLAVVLGMMWVVTGCDKPADPQPNYNTTNTYNNVPLPPDDDYGYDPAPPPPPPIPDDKYSGTGTGSTSGTWNYTVKQGDWLFKISRDQFGTDTRVKDIKALNPSITNWDQLKPGQVLKMPAK